MKTGRAGVWLDILASHPLLRDGSKIPQRVGTSPKRHFGCASLTFYSRSALPRSTQTAVSGFSVLELIVVMILMGILAAVVLPRFSRSSDVAARAARDDVLAALRYAQQLAMADATRTIQFVPTSNSFSLTANGAALPLPEGGGNYPRPLPTDVSLSPTTTLTYDGLGATTAVTYVLTTGESWSACVEPSGYAHAC